MLVNYSATTFFAASFICLSAFGRFKIRPTDFIWILNGMNKNKSNIKLPYWIMLMSRLMEKVFLLIYKLDYFVK